MFFVKIDFILVSRENNLYIFLTKNFQFFLLRKIDVKNFDKNVFRNKKFQLFYIKKINSFDLNFLNFFFEKNKLQKIFKKKS